MACGGCAKRKASFKAKIARELEEAEERRINRKTRAETRTARVGRRNARMARRNAVAARIRARNERRENKNNG